MILLHLCAYSSGACRARMCEDGLNVHVIVSVDCISTDGQTVHRCNTLQKWKYLENVTVLELLTLTILFYE